MTQIEIILKIAVDIGIGSIGGIVGSVLVVAARWLKKWLF
jgi:hypothetical protein